MRFIVGLMVLFFISTAAFGQRTSCHKFIPYFRTLNPEKLSYRLTHQLNNDSEKVEAIHCWITHHIRYDVKKSKAYNFNRVPVKKILCQRKALCIGYSDVFNELCKYANIISTDVPGYVKNENVDLNDKCYLDEHIWNAVYIDNEWKLIDVTWDAGYVTEFRPTFFGEILRLLTFKKRTVIKYDPVFKFYPTKKYYLKTGGDFIIDHIPADPIWQLTDTAKTVAEWETDSAYYLGSRAKVKIIVGASGADAERLRISQMTPKEKDLYIGPVAHSYNHKNHYLLAISHFIPGYDIFREMDWKSTDTIALLRQCDAALFHLIPARNHFDSTIYYLNQQKAELTLNNQKKNNTVKLQNRQLVSSTSMAARNLLSGFKIAARGKNALRSMNRLLKAQERAISRSSRFSTAKPLNLYHSIDSLNAVKEAELLRDSLVLINTMTARHFVFLDTLYQLCRNKMQQYANACNMNLAYSGACIMTRSTYYDDLDYEIRTLKDTLMKYKFQGDSLLFDSTKVFVLSSFYRKTLGLKALFKILYHYHKSLSDEYVKLKKFHADVASLTSMYKENIAQYQAEKAKYKQATNRLRTCFHAFKSGCKNQRKETLEERKSHIREKNIEMNMFSSRTKYINAHYKGLRSVAQRKVSECIRMETQLSKIKTRND